MYGTRDAAQNWEIAYAEFMEEIGFTRGVVSPCVFWHPERELRVVAHGDDFTSLGWEWELDWFKTRINERFETSTEEELDQRKRTANVSESSTG